MTGAVRAAVLGSPIAHSLSPALHAAAYRELGLDSWTYEAIECDEAGLPGLVGSLGPQWAGLSLTMPLKRAVLPLLDQAEPLVPEIGAANTVLLRAGRRIGHNTDVRGIASAMRSAGVTPAGNVAVIGGGATACAVLAALRGAVTQEVTVLVRAPARAEPLLAAAGRLGVVVRLAELGGAVVDGDWDLLVSTVPGHAADPVAAQITAGGVTARAVFDVVYDPWPTALAAAAAGSGATVISGYEMLVHQAAGQVELMTGRQAPVSVMRVAGLTELDRRRNIR
ncbi:MAG: shikimate dehydrogenase [Actinobacteria bacterium]|nr:shikimate dehydrogenase [Actinomycetota bacterium]MBO0838050.1 shikimate dehydrogenase [Actinomycetota bacterium]